MQRPRPLTTPDIVKAIDFHSDQNQPAMADPVIAREQARQGLGRIKPGIKPGQRITHHRLRQTLT